jgi:CheY-like chemotaxis protein
MSRVLLADDDATQLELQARLLETGGHQVALAFCPAETLRLLPTADVVIMDLRFRNSEGEPDVQEGLSLIRHIRESGCRAPVIVVSGWPEEIHEAPERNMVSRVMIKPVRIAALLAVIRELLI